MIKLTDRETEEVIHLVEVQKRVKNLWNFYESHCTKCLGVYEPGIANAIKEINTTLSNQLKEYNNKE